MDRRWTLTVGDRICGRFLTRGGAEWEFARLNALVLKQGRPMPASEIKFEPHPVLPTEQEETEAAYRDRAGSM